MNRDSREELRTALLIIRVYYEITNLKPGIGLTIFRKMRGLKIFRQVYKKKPRYNSFTIQYPRWELWTISRRDPIRRIPDVLLKKTSEQEQTLSGYLWVLLEVNEMASKKHITLKLKLLMQNLKACHVEFMGHLKQKYRTQNTSSVLQMVPRTFNGRTTRQIPLLGKLKLQTESLEHLSFSEAQLFLLMHYLSDRKSQQSCSSITVFDWLLV
ncbi:hypothetical protein H4Q26_012903 [Puccinia striiformis f. sp. tritici PST-130]|nr:hypothetical protein H4Q26_012903 [Puccinia striiformis f. sp. tritici PST-130]